MRPIATDVARSVICVSGWRRGVLVSGVHRMNEDNARRVRLVLGWVTVFWPNLAGIPSRYVTSQLGQLSLASLRGCLIEYRLLLGVKAGMSSLPSGR